MQGEAFLKAVETGWPDAALAAFRKGREGAIPLPVAVGVAAATEHLPLESTLLAFLTGFAANLVSAAIRLAPIGQSDGLRVLAGARAAPGGDGAPRRASSARRPRHLRAALRHRIDAATKPRSTRLFRS